MLWTGSPGLKELCLAGRDGSQVRRIRQRRFARSVRPQSVVTFVEGGQHDIQVTARE
jgi:hypothetical protein